MEPPRFKLQVANGHIEAPTKTIQLHLEIGNWSFKETFIVATNITGPIHGQTFLKNNSAIQAVSQALLHFTHLIYVITSDGNDVAPAHHKITVRNQLTLMPDQCTTIEPPINFSTIAKTTGLVHPIEQYSVVK